MGIRRQSSPALSPSLSKWIREHPKWVRGIRDILLFVGVFTGIQWWQTRNLVEIGQRIPAIELTDTTGVLRQIAATDKTTLLYFFAPWCSVCKAVNHNVVDLGNNPNLQVVAIALAYDDPETIQTYVKTHSMQRVQTLLGTDAVGRQFAISSFPTFYIVENGIVRNRTVGYTTELGLLVRSRL